MESTDNPTAPEVTGIVFYCDGSARPNGPNGHRGSGGHGYVWHYPKEDEKPTNLGVWVPTNEGYMLEKDQKEAPAGNFVPIVIDQYLDFTRSFESGGTNNSAEVEAVNTVFEAFQVHIQRVNSLLIITDSEYTKKEVEKFIHGYTHINQLRDDKPNGEALGRLFRHVREYKQLHEFEIRWVKGHSGHLGNDRADYLATIGTNRSMNPVEEQGVKIDLWTQESPTKNYMKGEVEIHDLLCLKRIYYNSGVQFNQPGVYYQAGASTADFIIGKRIPEAGFSVVKLNTPDPVIEAVRDWQVKTHVDFNTIMFMKMDRLRAPDVYHYLKEHGRACLYKQERSPNLIFLDKKPISMEWRPGELPLRAVSAFNHLEEMLDHFVEKFLVNGVFDPNEHHYALTDITSHFYDSVEKRVGKDLVMKKELKKDLIVGKVSHNYKLVRQDPSGSTSVTVPLRFMDDLPDRNTMKRIEKLNPQVCLITWMTSPQSIQYAVIIRTDDAVGIWSNYFANRIVLPF